MVYGFVILHYLTDIDTCECIDSIFKKCQGKPFEVVVVDNFSNNGSIERIRNQFKDVTNVHILYNAENLGFAKGNNVGYRYCREQLGCDTIIILNNDILIASYNLFECIEDDVQKYHPAVIGPDIESLIDGGHQNPMNITRDISRKSVQKDIVRYTFLSVINRLGVYDLLLHFTGRHNGNDKIPSSKDTRTQNKVQLHGSFMIFTSIFTQEMDVAFCPKTFMYMEESILYQICKARGMTMLYDPKMIVYHKEDSATNALTASTKKKRDFVFKNIIKSSKVLLTYL